MSGEWVICRKCALKFRTREAMCPRCDAPADLSQVRWSDQRGPAGPEEGSGLAIAVPVGVLLTAIASYVLLVTFAWRSAGELTSGLAVVGVLALSVSWAWAAVLAWRVSVPSFFLALLVPFVPGLMNKQWKTALPSLLGAASIAAGVFFAPAGFFSTSKETRIARLCESKAGEDCACVGAKTVGLMSPEDRLADLDAQSPALRELMLTSSSLCLKARLTARCVEGKQGTELQCICLIDRAVSSFTPPELEAILSGGTAPAKYSAMRTGCTAR